MKRVKEQLTGRRAFIATAAGLTTAAALRATIAPALAAATDPAVLVGRQYLEARDRFRAADLARDQREGDARKNHPKPPAELMVIGWPSTDGDPHLVYKELIDHHFRPQDRPKVQRLLAEHEAACAAVDARHGLPEMRAECDRLCDIEEELFEKLMETPATSLEGVAFKLRSIQDWISEDQPRRMMNRTLNDAERIAGLPLSPPYRLFLDDEA